MYSISYFVTELLGTDLHRLITSRPLEKQFIQYFLYQILVMVNVSNVSYVRPSGDWFHISERTQIRALGWCGSSRLGKCDIMECSTGYASSKSHLLYLQWTETIQHSHQWELRFEDLWFWIGKNSGPSNDWLCIHEILSSSWDYADMAEIWCCW